HYGKCSRRPWVSPPTPTRSSPPTRPTPRKSSSRLQKRNQLKMIFVFIYIPWRRGFQQMANIVRGAFILFFAFGILLSKGFAQERPYFVTYDHHMEEPENLEVATNPVIVRSSGIHSFIGNWTELEYGAKGWWTTEFYVDGQ